MKGLVLLNNVNVFVANSEVSVPANIGRDKFHVTGCHQLLFFSRIYLVGNALTSFIPICHCLSCYDIWWKTWEAFWTLKFSIHGKCTNIPVTYFAVVGNWRTLPLQEFEWKVKKWVKIVLPISDETKHVEVKVGYNVQRGQTGLFHLPWLIQVSNSSIWGVVSFQTGYVCVVMHDDDDI